MSDAAEWHMGEVIDEIRGKEIHCRDGLVGQVSDVLVDPASGRPLYLVWREAVVVTREVSIPIDYVERVEGQQIVLCVGREAVERLPHFWTAEAGSATRPCHEEGY
ncbi:MAG: PRC-barrel domain-containing protein [Anaerolineae bacterium]|nr:PRC-barrel domain-containing protein [Anaerolineae bacterium]